MNIFDHNEMNRVSDELDKQPPIKPKRNNNLFVVIVAIVCVVITIACSITTIFVVKSIVEENLGNKDRMTTQEVSKKFYNNIVEIQGSGLGSGIIVNTVDGKTVVLSNYHVTGRNSENVQIKFPFETGWKSNVTILGYDELFDVSILEIDYKPKSEFVNIFENKIHYSYDVDLGQGIVGLGNTLGYGVTAFDGIVSKSDKVIKPKDKAHSISAIQVTAPINAGNSGGGIFDLKGRLIGLNTYQTKDFEGAYVDGISYAMPMDIVHALYRVAIQERNGEVLNVTDTYLTGFDGAVNMPSINSGMDFNMSFVDSSLIVNFVGVNIEPYTMQVGDIIKSIGDTIIMPYNYSGILTEFLSYSFSRKGKQLIMEVERNGKSIKVSLEKYYRF